MSEAAPKLLRGLLEVFLLESLEQQPKHGYALLKEMGETFGAQPNRNRLYPLLAKLVSDGYVREVAESGGNRTLYALTEQGTAALHAYRRLPPQFRHALRRIWSDETHPAAAGPAGPAGPLTTTSTTTTARTVPVLTETAAADGVDAPPFPCVDARVEMEKDARTGDAQLRLTGCPMGAYEYCPECPIYKAVAGLVLTTSTK